MTARLNRGEGTLGRLSKDEKLINEVEGTVENIGDFVGGISRLQTIVSTAHGTISFWLVP